MTMLSRCCRRLPWPCLFLLACQTQPPPGPTPAAPGRIPLARLLQTARAENAQAEAILRARGEAEAAPARLNASLLTHGYFRRVPADAELAPLDTAVRQLATAQQLNVTRVEHHQVPLTPALPPAQLRPGQRWQPPLDQLRAVVQLSVDLQGEPTAVAAFIDALPRHVERLLVVTAATPAAGGVRLLAEAYWERGLPPPRVALHWPTLQERLRAAGWQPEDAALQQEPLLQELKRQLDGAETRLPDLLQTLNASAELPRWLLRHQFFAERTQAELSVQGRALLQQAGIPLR